MTDRHWTKDQSLVEQVEAGLKGGVTMVQLREKNLSDEEFLLKALELKELTTTYKVPFMINDNVWVAIQSDADGIHIGQDDLPADEVRKLVGEEKILGVSVQTVEQAQIAKRQGADYLGVGAVFSTDTKKDAKHVPLQVLKEICEAVNLKSTSSVHSHLETLEKNGYIRRDPTKPRAIEIVDDNFNLVRRETVNVPIVGKVAAGQPLLAMENVEGYFPIPSEFMPNNKTFMLVVEGDSMINAGIFSGDYVLVEQQPTAENGQKVVALVDDSATVKTFYKEKDYIRLQPENDSMDPILVGPEQVFQILGKVIGVFRFMR